MKAWDNTTSRWQTLYDDEADVELFELQRDTNQFHKFKILPQCQPTFASSIIRIEMDTYTITEWNELDYVKVVGATKHKTGVLTTGAITQTAQVEYVPHADFTGADSFTFEACDCAYDSLRSSLDGATVTVSVLPVNDAPIALSDSVVLSCAPEGSEEIALEAFDVDANTSFAFTIESLPSGAAFYDAGQAITSDMLPAALSGPTVSFVAEYTGVDEPPSDFVFSFRATDETGAVSAAAASTTVTCSATECAAGKYFFHVRISLHRVPRGHVCPQCGTSVQLRAVRSGYIRSEPRLR